MLVLIYSDGLTTPRPSMVLYHEFSSTVFCLSLLPVKFSTIHTVAATTRNTDTAKAKELFHRNCRITEFNCKVIVF